MSLEKYPLQTVSSTPLPPSSKRIAGLDGLRALAITLVLIFHFHPAALRGGFLGVDVFFVISGFLITTILLRQYQERNSLNLANFWVRRARRLFPAVVAVILVTIPVAGLINRDLIVGIRRQVFGALTFTTNWVEIIAGSSYFDRTSPVILANLWSLAVEEQFYLLWPLVLLALLQVARKWQSRAAIVISLGMVSALAMAFTYTAGQDPTRVYYGLDTHLFGLMIGAALALCWNRPNSRLFGGLPPKISGSVATIIGISGIILLSIFLSEDSAFTYRGGILLASFATALTIAGLLQIPEIAQKYVDNKICSWVGIRSYGIYLWHWPVLLIAEQAWIVPDDTWKYWVLRIFVLGITIAAAAISYRYLETPMRTQGIAATISRARTINPKISRPAISIFSILLGVCLLTIAAAPKVSSVTAQIQGEKITKLNIVTEAGAAAAQMEKLRLEQEAKKKAAEEAARAQALSEQARKAKEKNMPNPAHPQGEEITALGDSLIFTSKPGLEEKFPGIAVYAKSNDQWKHAFGLAKQAEKDGKLRRAVVIDFGTNAGLNDPQIVQDLIKFLGPQRQIILVNNYSRSSFNDETNQKLQQIANGHTNVELADWYKYASNKPEILQADRIHPNTKGMKYMAEAIDEAFQKLSVQLQKEYDSK
ncbi:acyltransferase [Actinomycetaceae bacterium TAE3-ERU4]|nr:acyltransferase [Actinomycetaceae bacterium TAE3-ERU4]